MTEKNHPLFSISILVLQFMIYEFLKGKGNQGLTRPVHMSWVGRKWTRKGDGGGGGVPPPPFLIEGR